MYRYELHMHSKEGSACSGASIEEMLASYARLGYTGVAVTNHFFCGNTSADRSLPWAQFVDAYSRAYYEGQDAAQKLGLQLIFGVEEVYEAGKEILCYGFEPDFLKDRPFLKAAPLEVWSREVHSVGGFVAMAHPFRVRNYIPDPDKLPDLSLLDGVEVFNSGNKPEDNDKAKAYFADSHLVKIAGADAHGPLHGIGGSVMLPEVATNSAELAQILKAGQVRVCTE